jgi:hypothetical protein
MPKRHGEPGTGGLDARIQVPAAAMLLQEGVEGGEQLRHGSGSVADGRDDIRRECLL